MAIFIGIDPDLHSLPIAYVDENMKIFYVDVLRIESRFTGGDAVVQMTKALTRLRCENAFTVACAIEAQDMRDGRGQARPQDIIHLANVAGAALACINATNARSHIYFPKPVQWKGSRDKLSHHHHICYRANIPGNVRKQMGGNGKGAYLSLDKHWATENIQGAATILPSDWKHVLDAVGLAQYAVETYQYETTKARMLAMVRSKN